jgi:hypothetical protein
MVGHGGCQYCLFHSSANGRKRKTKIHLLEDENGHSISQSEIVEHIVQFYKALFGSSPHTGAHLAIGFWDGGEKLVEEDRSRLSIPFSDKDVESAVAGMKTESASGPNRFSVIFFKKLWKIIKAEILNMASNFNKGTLDLRRLNYGVITLVPKVKEANTIKQYIPIYLPNVDFKIFPKLTTNRITPLADKIISSSQTAFIKGRNILEGVIILHEVICELRSSGKQGVLFKIDFEKTYDKVRCDFVKEVMVEKGFPNIWISQTMSTIQGERVCININGERSKFFNTYQGLRQGPLSPIMFNLVAKVLATMMKKAANQGKIKGTMSHLLPEGITHTYNMQMTQY